MKILHVTYCFYPESVGGTEIYVQALCRGLNTCGWENVVAAPAAENQSYVHEGIPVRRFKLHSEDDALAEQYGRGNAATGAEFSELLEELKPDVVHVHAVTGITARLVDEAKRKKLAVIMTYHTPSASCAQGALMYRGETVCDGELIQTRCSRCMLQTLGAPEPVSAILSYEPESAGRIFSRMLPPGKYTTALRMTELIHERHSAFFRIMNAADRIVAPSLWVENVLRGNGIAPAKIVRCAQGIEASFSPVRPGAVAPAPLRMVYVGRLEPVKGVEVLLRALRLIPECSVTLDIYGVDGGGRYLDTLKQLAGSDPRIRFLPAVAHRAMVSTLAGYDILAAPSLGLETGPLTVLEAFQAGIPVMGSDLGGIAERVQHGISGWLLPPGQDNVWAAAIVAAAKDRTPAQRMKNTLPKVRDMKTVAEEMANLYKAVLHEANA